MSEEQESEYAQAMREVIAKQIIVEGKLRTYFDPERWELILFRPREEKHDHNGE